MKIMRSLSGTLEIPRTEELYFWVVTDGVTRTEQKLMTFISDFLYFSWDLCSLILIIKDLIIDHLPYCI